MLTEEICQRACVSFISHILYLHVVRCLLYTFQPIDWDWIMAMLTEEICHRNSNHWRFKPISNQIQTTTGDWMNSQNGRENWLKMIIICEVHPRFDPVPSIKTFIEALSNFLNVTNTNTTNTTTTTTTNIKRKKTPSSAPLPISESTFRLIQCHHAANIFFSSRVERRSSWQKAGSITLEDRRWGNSWRIGWFF